MEQGRRLRKRREFEHVRRHGRSAANRYLVLQTSPNEGGGVRIGFAVGKRVGNAVRRNAVRRRLRESLRRTPLRPGWDIVVIARPEAARGGFHALGRAVTELLERVGLLDRAGGREV